MSVKELQNRNVSPALRAVIADSIQEILGDPDFGLELTAYAKRKLSASFKDTRRGKTLSEIRAECA
ncbi:MAG TPA: hypothetical protein VJ043_01685 [Candidatus Paceibacterota bacterium]|nr:hypothetical protein [Candidatus Paceibacterota bacterium]